MQVIVIASNESFDAKGVELMNRRWMDKMAEIS